MQQRVDAGKFCKDQGLGNPAGSQCYRGLTGALQPGRHCCYQKGQLGGPWASHVDKLNPARGQKDDGSCCYDFLALLLHVIVDTLPGYTPPSAESWRQLPLDGWDPYRGPSLSYPPYKGPTYWQPEPVMVPLVRIPVSQGWAVELGPAIFTEK